MNEWKKKKNEFLLDLPQVKRENLMNLSILIIGGN